ncbi:hypothetical protein GCM10010277_69510 [Streptomyces longisporoflavus]|nr:hypothetical protein GCM10010277_69510 [Streptomyces longisporoflavus]
MWNAAAADFVGSSGVLFGQVQVKAVADPETDPSAGGGNATREEATCPVCGRERTAGVEHRRSAIWLRSLQATAIVHRFKRQLTFSGGVNVHEK